MFRSFAEIESYILTSNIKKTVALAGSHDLDALSAVVSARKMGIIEAVLIGHEEKTLALLSELGEIAECYTIINEPNEAKAAAIACKLVKNGEADIPMKGLMQTSTFMRAILDKNQGFVPEKGLLSQATVLEYAHENRMILISDCAVNISPAYEDKIKILKNAVHLAQKLKDEKPLVAVIAAVELVNPAIPATLDAALLSKAAERGQLGNCIVDGPLALDNAVSLEAARHKGINSPVAGRASVMILPDLNTGNVLTKSLTYFAGARSAGCLCGTTHPVIMTSRADTAENKYFSILIAILQSA